jgi:ferredoxin
MTIEYTIDATRCEATGYCRRIAPHLFGAEDDGTARALVADPSEEDLEALREAEELCPARAIEVDAG